MAVDHLQSTNGSTSVDQGVKRFMDSYKSQIAELLQFLQTDKVKKDEIKRLIKTFYYKFLSALILSEYVLIVHTNGWNVLESWGLLNSSDFQKLLIDISVIEIQKGNLGRAIQNITKVTKENILTRSSDNKSKSKPLALELPSKAKEELLHIFSLLENCDAWNTLNSELHSLVGYDIYSIATRDEMIECMFFTAWDLYFQIIHSNPSCHIDLLNIDIDIDTIIDSIDKEKLFVGVVFEGAARHRMEDQIIMHVNRSYSSLITDTIKAIKLYFSDNNSMENIAISSVNRIYIQILIADFNAKINTHLNLSIKKNAELDIDPRMDIPAQTSLSVRS